LLIFPHTKKKISLAMCIFHVGKWQFSRSIITYVLQRGRNSFTNWLGPAQLSKELKANTEPITSLMMLYSIGSNATTCSLALWRAL
jgi:hypothetical protein